MEVLRMMDISTPYYSDLSRISNSNIGWFLQKGPAYLHKMLTDPPPEEKNSTLERGTMIHEYILQPEEFQKDYVIWNKPKPTSAQQEKFCQALALSTEIEPNKAILSAYKESYSTKGKSDDLMLSEGLKIASTMKDYIDFLKANDGRIMISPWDVKMLEKIKHNIQSHKLANKIVWPDGKFMNYDYSNMPKHLKDGHIADYSPVTFHEFHINWEWQWLKEHVSCKSLLDGLTIDFQSKIVIIYDLKTTQKLWHFEDSMEMYDYERQLSYYTMAVKWYLENECGIDGEDIAYHWKFLHYIIGIDTTGSYEIRVFKVELKIHESKKLNLVSTTAKIEEALFDIAWHQSTGKWDHSREYYEGDGAEILNL